MNVITVSQLNSYIKSVLEQDVNLNLICIAGEVSNFVHYYKSGHMYFTLKDDKSQLKAVMFSSNAEKVKFKIENGLRVICRGRVSAYEKDGQYQLYVDSIQPDGIGELSLAYEQLKQRLFEEGLFDDEHKKALPRFPRRIGVATSNMGAAVEDIKNITKRRYPLAEIVIAPTIVQGDLAPDDIVKSIKLLDSIDDIDVIIVGRGGGSIEDLWAFNTEIVARAVYECKKPIISAVGHETDYTICDFVADVRAETPSAAAEKAVPDINVIMSFVNSSRERMLSLINYKLQDEMQRLDNLQNKGPLSNFSEYIENYKDILDGYTNDMLSILSDRLRDNSFKLSGLADKLNSLSPLAVLSRGYSVVSINDRIINSTKSVKVNDVVDVTLSDGRIICTVKEVD